MIRDGIILGVKDNHTRKKLLQEKKLDLQRCIDVCRSNEKSESQLKSLADVHHIKVKQKVKQDSKHSSKTTTHNPFLLFSLVVTVGEHICAVVERNA